MEPLTAAFVLGGSQLFGNVLTNQANASLADQQMNFQQRNSDTAHQREVADLAAAGLNPLLSARYGGASTPQGAMAPQYNPFGGVASAFADSYRAGLEGERNPSHIELNRQSANQASMRAALDSAQQNLVQEQTRTQQETTWKVAMEQVVLGIQSVKEAASTKAIETETQKLAVEVRILVEELKTARNKGEVSESQYGRIMSYIERLPGVGGFMSGVGSGMLAAQYRQRLYEKSKGK